MRTKVGCLPDLFTETLDQAFAARIGPLIGWDNPHVYPLGEGRWLWTVQDSWLDYAGNATRLDQRDPQIQNMAIVQDGTCWTLIHRGNFTTAANFEPGNGAADHQRFFWPLGGELHDGRLTIFWSEMVVSDPRPAVGDGIVRHPVATWIADYDAATLERLSFAPAPNSGVFPSYGFAVASDEEHTYLFGNSNLLNLQREGGFYNGPHSATLMYLARVPRGQLHQDPEYRTADGWSPDPALAVPISERFWAENTMQPRYLDGRWIAVTKVDGFWGDDIVIDVAPEPWGPWTTVHRFRYDGRPGRVPKNSYQPILLPWRGANGDLQVVISENARDWPQAIADPSMYRPAVLSVPWPEP